MKYRVWTQLWLLMYHLTFFFLLILDGEKLYEWNDWTTFYASNKQFQLSIEKKNIWISEESHFQRSLETEKSFCREREKKLNEYYRNTCS